MPRSGNAFAFTTGGGAGGISTWGGPTSTDALSITGWNNLRADLEAALSLSFANDGTGTMTGPLLASSGAIGAPSLAMSADPDTGFWRSVTGQWQWSADGAVAYIFASGVQVADNSLGVVTSAAVKLALATAGPDIKAFACLSANSRPYTGTGSAQPASSTLLGVPWAQNITATGVTVSVTTPRITVTHAGTYRIFHSGTINMDGTLTPRSFTADIRLNGANQTPLQRSIALGATTAGETWSIAADALLTLTAGQYIELYFTATNTEVFQLNNYCWGLERIA